MLGGVVVASAATASVLPIKLEFPRAIAKTSDGGYKELYNAVSGCQEFYCIFAFIQGAEDFVLQGIFSKKEEADELGRALNPHYDNGMGSVHNTDGIKSLYVVRARYGMQDIIEHIAKERLGKLHDNLMRMEKGPDTVTILAGTCVTFKTPVRVLASDLNNASFRIVSGGLEEHHA